MDTPRAIAYPSCSRPRAAPTRSGPPCATGPTRSTWGLEALNARRGAENFTLETLAEACRFAHLRGVRVYLTANIVVLAEEMDARARDDRPRLGGRESTRSSSRTSASCPRCAPRCPRSASTPRRRSTRTTPPRSGCSRTSACRGSRSPARSRSRRSPRSRSGVAGGARVVRARLAVLLPLGPVPHVLDDRRPLREPRTVRAAVPAALRPASERAATPSEVDGRYLLSPKDLAGIALLPDLARAGVAALKIEGRMKSPEYVASVVSRVPRGARPRWPPTLTGTRSRPRETRACSRRRSAAGSPRPTCPTSATTR